jgi:serine/threonine protein kinase
VRGKVDLSKRALKNIKKVYEIMKDDRCLPKLFSINEYIYTFCTDDDEEEDEVYVFLIHTENGGKSVAEVYNLRGGPGPTSITVLNDRDTLHELFDPRIVPKNIIDNVIDILILLTEKGIIHEDIHPGNFLIDRDNTVRIIDFEYVSFAK